MVLITGGFGYLGGRIANDLRKSGYSLRIGTSRDKLVFKENQSPNEIVKLDFLNDKSLEAACKNVSIVIHLAAMNAESCLQDPDKALLVNGEGTSRLIKAAIKKGVDKFIYFSTAHVYGSPLKGNLNENILPKPQHPYADTHHIAEKYVTAASNNKLIKGVVLRLTNAVGPPSNKNANCWMLVSNDLCRQVATKKTMTINASSYLQRDFISISEVCKVVYRIINSSSLNSGIFNLSSGSSISLMDLADLISHQAEKILKYTPTIEFISQDHEPPNDYQALCISNNKLKEYGIEINSDISFEIDNLLINCSKWF